MLNSQKVEDELNLALDATQSERERSAGLETGYDPKARTWELIVKYSGDLEAARSIAEAVTELSAGYAILLAQENRLEEIISLPQIEYVEKPKRLFFQRTAGKRASCLTGVQTVPLSLTGRGVLVAVLDSGVDIQHPEFLNPDGSTRIAALWDQTIEGNPPEGYARGTEYTKAQIDEALRDGEQILSRDSSGHGTGVLAVAAGNRGVARDSEILVVKLGTPSQNGFPKTTELMTGLDYVIRKAQELGMPVAVNISFGNTYGSHRGTSLLETYVDEMSSRWKTVICVGSGNEGARAGHTSVRLQNGRTTELEFTVGAYEPTLSLQIWKNYADRFSIYLAHPAGRQIGPLYEQPPAQRYQIGRTQLLAYYGEPVPYMVEQEIFIELLPEQDYIDAGVWTIRLVPEKIVDGRVELWFPASAATGNGTRFLNPVESGTLTIPSTASKVITVGAYDATTDAYADFSGRGFADAAWQTKPDLVAPGVSIQTAAPGGGYVTVSGTSYATPFVTGSAAILMQWGIVEGHDPYLYGEKVKAWLRRGARPLPAFTEYPNEQVGYGRLCILEAFPRSSVPPFVW